MNYIILLWYSLMAKGNRTEGKHNKGKKINYNPNSKATQFGQAGIIGGMSTEQRKAAVDATNLAAKIRHKLLKKVAKQMGLATTDDVAIALVTPVIAGIMENADRRVFGTPVATVNTNTNDLAPKGLGDFYDGLEVTEEEIKTAIVEVVEEEK
mgnify:CR=1 FL=1